MPTLLDYLGIPANTVCFGTSVFRNPDGWQIAYGNGYYQLESKDGVTVISQYEVENPDKPHPANATRYSDLSLLKSLIQQYNHRLINNQLTR